MKNLIFTLLGFLCINSSLMSQIGHDTCEDALLVPLDFCDYTSFFTDFTLAQDETSDPNVDAPCSVGPYHDAWFKFSTDGQNEFAIEVITNGMVHFMGIELSDACSGNVLDCDTYETGSFDSYFFSIPSVDSIWVRIWFVNNTFQDIASFCFSNLTILSVDDIVLIGEVMGIQNQLNWELNSGLVWERMMLQVYNEREGIFTTIKNFNKSEAVLTPLSFSYNDPNPMKASTYRLLIIDKDEKQHFSNTLFIENKDALLQVKLSNPSFDQLHIFANDAGIEASYKIKVLDANGRQWVTSETSMLDGFSMDISNLAAGIYYAWIINQLTGVPQVLKFIKL